MKWPSTETIKVFLKKNQLVIDPNYQNVENGFVLRGKLPDSLKRFCFYYVCQSSAVIHIQNPGKPRGVLEKSVSEMIKKLSLLFERQPSSSRIEIVFDSEMKEFGFDNSEGDLNYRGQW
ncbi:MAG: hypothetical protein PHY93_20950 [Bacteriovorax sp.]|nr:hypothetical protein [Bacteriovorax sp.]